MALEPEIHEPIREPGVTTQALVPTRPARFGRVARWMQRLTGAPAAPPSFELPAGVSDLPGRLERLESRLATHAEETYKRLEESEGRMEHRMQQRFESLRSELEFVLRTKIEREVEDQTGPLRRWLVVALLLALCASGAAALALFQLFARSG